MADVRHFAYSSDYTLPCFVYKVEDSVTNTAGTILGGCKKFRHNLPFTPILVGVWSTSGDFSTSYNIGEERFLQGDGNGFVAFADDTYVYVKGIVSNDQPTTFFYKLYSYCPVDYSGEVEPINDVSTFNFDTDYVYLQVLAEGKVLANGSKTHEIDHNLGYLPIFKIWRTVNIDFWEDGLQTIRGLCPSVSYAYPTETPSMWNAVDRQKLYITWYEDRSLDQNDYAYYQIYSNEA